MFKLEIGKCEVTKYINRIAAGQDGREIRINAKINGIPCIREIKIREKDYKESEKELYIRQNAYELFDELFDFDGVPCVKKEILIELIDGNQKEVRETGCPIELSILEMNELIRVFKHIPDGFFLKNEEE